MNVLFVSIGFLPAVAWGGPVTVIHLTSHELLQRGHSVSVCASNLLDKRSRIGRGSFRRDVDGVSVTYLDTHVASAWRGTVGPSLLTPKAMLILWWEVARADVVHVHGGRNTLAIAGSLFAHMQRKPLVVQPHGGFARILSSRGLKRVFDWLFVGPLLRRADRVIVLTNEERDVVCGLGAPVHNVRLLGNGIDTSGYDGSRYVGRLRSDYGIPESKLIILFLARLNAKKGADLLVEAYARLDTEYRDSSCLVIAGPDDGQLAELDRLVRKRGLTRHVIFTGCLADDDVKAAFADCDVFVLPCRSDAFPMAILEACQARRPIIVTDACEMAPLLAGGAMVIPVDIMAIAAALREFLCDDGSTRRRYGEAAGKLGRTLFSIGRVVDSLEDIYDDVLTDKDA